MSGAGSVAELAAAAGAHVTGIDLSPRLVEVARARAQAGGYHIHYARELARVVRPGGRLRVDAGRARRPDVPHDGAFQPPPPEGAGIPLRWGGEDPVRELLDAFDLRIERRMSRGEEESVEGAWEGSAGRTAGRSTTGSTCSSPASGGNWHPGAMARQKHSEKRLDERLDEEVDENEPRGILELFERDEDAPISREPDEADDR